MRGLFRGRGNRVLLSAILVCAGMLGTSSWAATVYVKPAGDDANNGQSWDTAKKTVAAGLAAAVSGDEVWVAAGTYVERITLKNGVGLYGGFAGGEMLLTERDWVSNVTILDGNALGTVVFVPSGSTASTRVDGFTIRNGRGSSGGGVLCSGSSVVIANNIITGNMAMVSGGGIYHFSTAGAPMIVNNTIVHNSVTGSGGGVFVASGAPVVANNVIGANCAASSASSTGGGGGIFCGGSQVVVTNNTITGNIAPRGGGLHCGAGTVSNNIVAFNSSGIYKSSGAPILRNNCVYNPDVADYVGVSAGEGDISVDPQLLEVGFGQAHLLAGSPCIDAGYDGAVQAGWVDLDGQARIQGEPSGHVDIGADEFSGATYSFTPRVVRVSLAGNDANDGSSWDQAKRTVQAGIDAASAAGGAEVWVAAGTYDERISLKGWAWVYGGFDGAETSRDGRDAAAHVTILDGGAKGSVVTSTANGHRINGIDGFTIQNGTGTYDSDGFYGGGVYCNLSSPCIAHNTITGNSMTAAVGGGIGCTNVASPVIQYNTITGNTVGGLGAGVGCVKGAAPRIAHNTITANAVAVDTQGGGGIGCRNASPLIVDNVVMGNTVRGYFANGGGIYCREAAPLIAGNRIDQNSVAGGCGGGIACFQSSSATISNNSIATNTGAGVYCDTSSPMIANNVIAANTPTSAPSLDLGGGILCTYSSPVITNNTIVQNAGMGGGICCSLSSSPTISNNLVAFNSLGVCSRSSAPILRNNCVYQLSWDNYVGVLPGTGDISLDPQLVEVDFREYHLKVGSPCIDAGSDSAVQADWVDIDGEARIQSGGGGHVDIGADEFNGVAPVYVPTVVRVRPSGNDANDGLSWGSAKLTVQAGIDAVAGEGGEVWVAAGTYYERITLKSWSYVYGGFGGEETSRSQRDWTVHVCILDGQAAGPVVNTASGAIGCSLDGFTVRNGGGNGTVYCVDASPTLANNTIWGRAENWLDAISCWYSAPLIIRNTIVGGYTGVFGYQCTMSISENTISGNISDGVECTNSSLAVFNNTISGNGELGGVRCDFSSFRIVANLVSGNGGCGVYVSSPFVWPSMISRNVIAGNSTAGRGGGIASYGSVTISDNVIMNNSAFGPGGGLSCSSATVINNTIVGNVAPSGGGVDSPYSGTSTVTNNIVAFNSSGMSKTDGAVTSRNNCVFNPDGADYTDVSPGDGDISLDPLLVDWPAGDCRLLAGSPCLDAGLNSAVPAGLTVDLDGHARFMNDPATPDCQWAPGTCGTAPIVDIGAYEYIAGDFDRDGDLDAGDAAVFAACLSGPSVMYAGDCLKADFDRDGDVDLADFGVFQRCYTGADRAVNPDCGG